MYISIASGQHRYTEHLSLYALHCMISIYHNIAGIQAFSTTFFFRVEIKREKAWLQSYSCSTSRTECFPILQETTGNSLHEIGVICYTAGPSTHYMPQQYWHVARVHTNYGCSIEYTTFSLSFRVR